MMLAKVLASLALGILMVKISLISSDLALKSKFLLVASISTLIVLNQLSARNLLRSPFGNHFQTDAQLFLWGNGLLSFSLAVLSFFPSPLWGFVVANTYYALVALELKETRKPKVIAGISLPILVLGIYLALSGEIGQGTGLAGASLLAISFANLVGGRWHALSRKYLTIYTLACFLLGISAFLAGPAFVPFVFLEALLVTTFLYFSVYDYSTLEARNHTL